ncbi:hypothetical protein JD844_018271, partial [Phrynosoma platyrhinos]
IVYRQGDLFTCPETNSLANCISEDCHMSAGIAAVFKKRFGGVEELLNQQRRTGDVAVLKRDNRYVYYLWQSQLDSLCSRIGCGLDCLDWRKVSTMLEEVFEGTGVYITVYTL